MFQKTNPDIAVHLAFVLGATHHPKLEGKIALDGCRNFFIGSKNVNLKHAIFVSSASAYGAHPNNPFYLGETSKLRGNEDYSYTKWKRESDLLAQELSKDMPFKTTIFRPCLITEPKIQNQFFSFLKLPFIPHFGRDVPFQFISVDDVVETILSAVNKEMPGIFNLAGRGEIRMSEMAMLVGKKYRKLPFKPTHALTNIAWKLRLIDFPSGILSFIKNRWLIDANRSWNQLHMPKLNSPSAFKHSQYSKISV